MRIKRERVERRRSAAGGMGKMESRRGTGEERWWRKCRTEAQRDRRGKDGVSKRGELEARLWNWFSCSAALLTKTVSTPCRWAKTSFSHGKGAGKTPCCLSAALLLQPAVLGAGRWLCPAVPCPALIYRGRLPSVVRPGCLAALKGKWDCRELLLCTLFWSSYIPASF